MKGPGETVGCPGTGMTGSCEVPNVVLETEFGSSIRTEFFVVTRLY